MYLTWCYSKEPLVCESRNTGEHQHCCSFCLVYFNGLLESHLDVHYHMQIYTYKYIKYIRPFYEELQETRTVKYPQICTILKNIQFKTKKKTLQRMKYANEFVDQLRGAKCIC